MVAFAFTAATGLGAFFFVMVQYLTGSAWSVTVRRIMENIMITLPVGALLFIPIAFGLKDIYSWTDTAMVAADPVLKLKVELPDARTSSCCARTIYFVLWSIWIFAIYRQSTKQDTEKSIRQMHIISRWSAPGLFLVVVVGTLASYDWLMSMEPKWYSTIFGLYILSGGALTFMCDRDAGLPGLPASRDSEELDHDGALSRSGQVDVRADGVLHLHRVFAIPADLVREPAGRNHLVSPSVRREAGSSSALAMPFIRFMIPFFTLLCRPAKRSLTMIGVMAVWCIVVEYIDLYWVVMPAYYKDGPQIHWLDFATLAATVSICGLVFWSRFRKHKMVPVGDCASSRACILRMRKESIDVREDTKSDTPIRKKGFDRTEPQAGAIAGFAIGSVVLLIMTIVALQRISTNLGGGGVRKGSGAAERAVARVCTIAKTGI